MDTPRGYSDKKRGNREKLILLLSVMGGFAIGVFLYARPEIPKIAAIERLLSGFVCGFISSSTTLLSLCYAYLYLVLPLFLLLLAAIGNLTFPTAVLLSLAKGFLSGYCCAGLLDLQTPSAAVIFGYLLFLFAEGLILLLTLAFAKAVLQYRDIAWHYRLRGIFNRHFGALGTDFLFLCGILLLVLLLRGLLCPLFLPPLS